MANLDSILKSRDITLPKKVCVVKVMTFSVVMYRCESWTIKKVEPWRIDAFKVWCWRRLLRAPLDCKEIKPINLKGNQSWIFIGKTDAEAEAPILCPPASKSQLIDKSFSDAGKDWRQKKKGTAEDEMIGWHHWLNGNEFWQTPGDSEGQGSLAAAVHGVTKSGTRLKDWTTTNTTILISVAFTKFLNQRVSVLQLLLFNILLAIQGLFFFFFLGM